MPRREWLAVVAVFLLTLPALTSRFYASDEVQFYAWLRSWTFDRDIDFQNEYQYFNDHSAAGTPGFRETFLTLTNEAGRRPNFAPIGCALLWAPFYAVGHVVALATGASADGFSQPYITAVTVGSAAYGAAALIFSLAIARRFTGTGASATLLVLVGTPLVFYMYVAPGFSHACSAFAVSLFLWLWLRIRDRWSPTDAILLGAAGALMAMVREQDVFFVAGPALDFLVMARRRGTAALPSAIAGVLAFLVAYAPQLLAYEALNGHPGPTTLVARKMTWSSPHFFGVLLSPAHGLLFWTPLVIVALAGLVMLSVQQASERRWVGALFMLMVVLQVYINGCVESWTVAGSFGQRRFLALTPLLVLGLASLQSVTRTGPLKWTRIAIVGVCVWWNLGLMTQFALHRMDRQRLTLGDNARQTFLVLPREVPGIAWRYLVDRRSFYGASR